MAYYDEYLWMAVLGVIFAFTMAFGIGANDVANAFGSSVSAGSLSLGQAVVLGSIFEFAGSILLGQSVTGTIRNGILEKDNWSDQPDLLMFGMLCSLLLATIWLMVATALELPVSTTHTIVAGIMGFSIAAEGFESLNMYESKRIFISWVFAPSFTGAIAFVFYFTVKNVVLSSENTFERAMLCYPVVLFAGITVNIAFIMLKSAKKINEHKERTEEDWGRHFVIPCAFGSGLFAALVFQFLVGPWLRKKVQREHAEHVEALEREAKEFDKTSSEHPTTTQEGLENSDKEEVEPSKPDESKEPTAEPASDSRNSVHKAWDYFAENTFRQDLKEMSLSESKHATEIWENAEIHDPMTERLFSYLQVFTACLSAFSHGSNDVANAIAPASAIIEIYKSGEIPSKSAVEKWLLAVGGAGISIGFCLYGYKIIKAVGFKLTCITPSRGFCIELASALAVSTASYMEMPVSTTQCLVGATVGAGVASGGLRSVDWLFFLRVMFGWVSTFFITVITSACFFAFCIYSPSEGSN